MKKLLVLTMSFIMFLGMFTFMSQANDHFIYPDVAIQLDEAVLNTSEYNGVKNFSLEGRIAVSTKLNWTTEVFIHYTTDNGSTWTELPVGTYNDHFFSQDRQHRNYALSGIYGSYEDFVTIQFKLEARSTNGSLWDDNNGQLYTVSNEPGKKVPAIVSRIPATIIERSYANGIDSIYVMTKKDVLPESVKPVVCVINKDDFPSNFYDPLEYYPISELGQPSYVKTYPGGYQLWEFKIPSSSYNNARYCVTYGPYISWRMGAGF